VAGESAGIAGALSVQDRQAIEALLIRYATAADARDAAMLASCFTADAKAEYGEPIGSFDSRAELVGGLMAMLANCGETLHYISNVVIEPTKSGAATHCYTHAIVHVPGMDQPMRTAGTYADQLICGDGGWRIAQRVYRGVA
tara:strand:- start:310 stop:735 length:426 start_codon:yes stop_codon:yes gene_type:complete